MLHRKGIPFIFILKKIKYEVLFVFLYANAAYFLISFTELKWLSIPITIPTVLGTAISLLLAFRTAQSYDRWWEARMIWGSIVNDSRTLIRQLLSFTGEDEKEASDRPPLFRSFAHRQIAWCYCLSRSLRKQVPLEGLEEYISQEELEKLYRVDNKPNAILGQHARDISSLKEEGRIDAYQQMQLDSTLARLTDAMGKCERIKSTVFPHTYSLYIHFFIFLFVAVLPFGLIQEFGYLEVPLLIAIASAFFLIENTAKQMQDPFEDRPTDTAMNTISRVIEINIKDMLGEEAPSRLEPERFYSM